MALMRMKTQLTRKGSKVYAVRVPKGLGNQMESRVEKKGLSLNKWMIWAIRQGLRSHKKPNTIKE